MNYRLYIIYYRVSLEKEYRMMYRIGICDDEEACRIKISESIRNIALKNDIEVKIIQYESGIQVMDCEKPDILILDIEMEHIDGLEVRDLLEQTDNEVLIIFCTSHDEIMSKAYGRNVTDFIKKPVREEEIEKKLLHAINDIEVKIIQYESGIQVMDCEKPDILILDIEMEHIDGLEVRDLLEQTDNEVLIIFCTSHDEIMSKAYGRNVTDFIKKPVREEEIEKKLLHAINIINRRVKWICLNTISGLTKFKISDIVYGIAQGRYLKIYMLDGSEYFITDKGVSQLYEMLKDMNFARISRSVIINFENVNTIGDEIIMTDGVKLKSSRRMKKQIQEDFFNYMCKVARVERADR